MEWFPNRRKRDTGEQAGGWTDRSGVTATGARSFQSRRGHLLRVVSGDQCSPIEHVTGEMSGLPPTTVNTGSLDGVTGGEGEGVRPETKRGRG